MRKVACIVVMSCLSLISSAFGQPGPTPPPASRPDASSVQDKLRQYRELNQQLVSLLEKKDFAASAEVCRKMIELAPRDPSAHYNLACCLARLGKPDDAIAELRRAISAGFVDVDHIRKDDDLASLRQDKRFTDLLESAYDKGEPIDGVKTVEGDPENGLRWRLRISPAAGKDHPHKLIVWLHPSGGSMNKTVEALSAELAKRGFALLVLTAKDWSGWSTADADKLMTKTLPDVAKVEGVDVDRPVLLGYSAGGQIALILWSKSPEKFGGLVLDAAYPVVADPKGTGRFAVMNPPRVPSVQDCPFFVLVGEKDQAVGVWVAAEDPYRKAGVPLTINYVSGMGHTWLFGGAQRDKLYKWLEELAAGKKPGAASAPDSSATSQPATSQPSGPRRPIRLEDVY